MIKVATKVDTNNCKQKWRQLIKAGKTIPRRFEKEDTVACGYMTGSQKNIIKKLKNDNLQMCLLIPRV